MAKLLRADLPDADWEAAMKVLCHVGIAANRPAATAIAKHARGASGLAPQGMAVRRSASQKLLAAFTPAPARLRLSA